MNVYSKDRALTAKSFEIRAFLLFIRQLGADSLDTHELVCSFSKDVGY